MLASSPLTLIVVPRVGTWIEIGCFVLLYLCDYVVPRVGTWIEIAVWFCIYSSCYVVPRVGTWIEITIVLNITEPP